MADPAGPWSLGEEPGFVTTAVGSHWGVLSRGRRRPDFTLNEEDCFGCCEENGRKGGKNGAGKAMRPGPQVRAGRADK